MVNTIIVAGGTFPEEKYFFEIYNNNDIIIAVDRGYDFLNKLNIRVDYLMGDFDSIDYKLEDIKTPEIIKFPEEKDLTDLHIAINKAIELHSNKVTIFGGTGTRLDHTIANIFLLRLLHEQGIESKILDKNNEIQIAKGRVEIERTRFKYISIIPLSDDTIISIEGVKYPLKNKKVSIIDSLCISNEIKEKIATLEVSDYSIVIQSID